MVIFFKPSCHLNTIFISIKYVYGMNTRHKIEDCMFAFKTYLIDLYYTIKHDGVNLGVYILQAFTHKCTHRIKYQQLPFVVARSFTGN